MIYTIGLLRWEMSHTPFSPWPGHLRSYFCHPDELVIVRILCICSILVYELLFLRRRSCSLAAKSRFRGGWVSRIKTQGHLSKQINVKYWHLPTLNAAVPIPCGLWPPECEYSGPLKVLLFKEAFHPNSDLIPERVRHQAFVLRAILTTKDTPGICIELGRS